MNFTFVVLSLSCQMTFAFLTFTEPGISKDCFELASKHSHSKFILQSKAFVHCTSSVITHSHRTNKLRLVVSALHRNTDSIHFDNYLTQPQHQNFELELNVILPVHKPLGCTVEESLTTGADEDALLITRVVSGGNADKNGLTVGDVIFGVSGAYDEIVKVGAKDSVDGGIDKLKQLISCRSENTPLTLSVLRGSDIMARHEAAVEDLCLLPGGTDDGLKSCIDDIYSADDLSNVISEDCCTDGSECLLDDMQQMWGSELSDCFPAHENVEKDDWVIISDDPISNSKDLTTTTSAKKKVMPWSSRSSPSGTFVRNPKTGKMENIDA